MQSEFRQRGGLGPPNAQLRAMNHFIPEAWILGAGLVALAIFRPNAMNFYLAILGAEMARELAGAQRRAAAAERDAAEEDIVDLGSELSFPASDPPAY